MIRVNGSKTIPRYLTACSSHRSTTSSRTEGGHAFIETEAPWHGKWVAGVTGKGSASIRFKSPDWLDDVHILSELATLFLHAAGDEQVSCFCGDVLEVKGHLEAIFANSI